MVTNPSPTPTPKLNFGHTPYWVFLFIMETILIKGLSIECKLIRTYSNGKLFFAQERLVVTDLNNIYTKDMDVIDLVKEIL